MEATKTGSSPSSNGNAASTAVAKAKQAGDSVATVARKAKGPAITAGATAAGLAGGLALGARMGSKRRKILGIPVGRKSGLTRTAEALGHLARELGSASNQAAATTEDVRQIREQLDKANRRSPLEVVLDGLTHRRGAHKRES
jgi:hypothetical protein